MKSQLCSALSSSDGLASLISCVCDRHSGDEEDDDEDDEANDGDDSDDDDEDGDYEDDDGMGMSVAFNCN